MRPIIFALSLAAMGLVGSSGAFAQDMVIERYAAPSYYYEYRSPAPRVYRFRSDEPAVVIRPGSCGEFRYWNGERCVDARINPPDLK